MQVQREDASKLADRFEALLEAKGVSIGMVWPMTIQSNK